ncbi:MAG: hypothetical protein O3A29_19550 [Planctomycetota bacterium]|nr:hypothetical protein [Planctomycetota bacterium]
MNSRSPALPGNVGFRSSASPMGSPNDLAEHPRNGHESAQNRPIQKEANYTRKMQ